MIENPETSNAPSPTLGDDAEAFIRELASGSITDVGRNSPPNTGEYIAELLAIYWRASQILADHDDE